MASTVETDESEQETPETTPFIASESEAFTEVPRKKGRGRPRKDGAPPGSRPVATVAGRTNGKQTGEEKTVAPDVPGPRLTKFYSDHDSPHQRTRALWTWWNQLPEAMKQIIEAHVYREWPVLLDPPEDWCDDCKLIMSPELGKCPRCGEKLKAQGYKYIDKIIGVQPIQNDQDFIDKYGAGDYHLYLNVNPAAGTRRTLAEAWIKGSHDYRLHAPNDDRIAKIENVSLADPRNTAYVAWLRSQGKIPDEQREKERDDMAASSVIVEKVLEQNNMLMGRVLDKENEPPPASAPAETPQQQTLGMFDLLERLQGLMAANKGNNTDIAALMQSAVSIAQALSKANDPSPYLQKISELESQVRRQEAEQRQKVLDEIREEVRSLKNPPQTTVTTTDGTNLQSIIEKAVGKAVEKAGLGEAEDNAWYIDPLKQLVPVAIPALIAGLQTFFMPRTPMTQPAMPAANPGFPGPAPQAQLPAPQQPAQPQTQAQPQNPQASAAQQEIVHILTAIAAPVIDSLSRDMDGDDFADEFIQEHGNRAFRLISSFTPEQIAATLYQFPLTAPNMTQFPQEKVLKFAQEFKGYLPDAYDKKIAAKEAGGSAA